MKRKSLIAAVMFCVASSLSFHGCASPGKKTAIGAGAGAGGGAIIGGIAGGWKGAAIGGALGAAAGGAIGNMLDKQAQELNEVAETQRTANGIIVKLKNDLLFDSNSSVLKPQAIDDISQLGDIIAKYPKDRLRIEGFTDNVGKQSYNEALSKKRAQAVKEVLIGRNVKASQITTLGMGPTNPIASNKTNQGRSANRRVEIHIDAANQST